MSDSTRSGPRSRSTLHDVAQMAGVSPSTVSAVLAGKSGARRISPDTHQRVHGAAAQLGYTPNLLHRSMRRGRTNVLSFYNAFRNREWSDLYMDRLAAAVEHAAGGLGYNVLVQCDFRSGAKETYEFLNGGFADGLILFGPFEDDPLLPFLRDSNLPTVLIDPRGEEPTLSAVRDDEATGMRLIADALVDAGHRRIGALVEEIGGALDPLGRVRDLRANLAVRGIELSPENVVVWNGSAVDAVAELLAMAPRPTAFFVWHDRAAYRVVEACEAAGVRIPQDLSIVGYDGLVWPSVTGHVVASVVVELDQIGRAAVSLLDRMIAGEAAPLSETVSVSFQPGTTLAPPSFPSAPLA